MPYVYDPPANLYNRPFAGHQYMTCDHIPSTQAFLPELTERHYRSPCPTIPCFCSNDPSEFARLKLALDNLLPPESTEMFQYRVLIDHLKLDDALLVPSCTRTPYRDTMIALNERYGQPHQVAFKRIATILKPTKC